MIEKMTEQEKDKAVTRALTAYSVAHRAYLSAKGFSKAAQSEAEKCSNAYTNALAAWRQAEADEKEAYLDQQRALTDLNNLIEAGDLTQ